MKIILSRKGFDTKYGGQPSPVMPNGDLVSLPIPSENDKLRYTDLKRDNKSYFDIIKELNPSTSIKEYYTCHLDPELSKNVIRKGAEWKPLFGQSKAALSHLQNHNIQKNDLFLFFGWFRKTSLNNGKLVYQKGLTDFHIIWGYMQIGNIHKNVNELPQSLRYHAHYHDKYKQKNNCIFQASEKLSIIPDLPGASCLKYNPKLVLTKPGFSKSRWSLPNFFRDVEISYHTSSSWNDKYFQSASIGQEFVIEANEKIVDWVKTIINSSKPQEITKVL